MAPRLHRFRTVASANFLTWDRPSIFFDLDGTLTDPKIGIVRCIEYALDRLAIERPDGDLTWCIGPPLADSFTHMLGDRVLAQRAVTHYRERFADIGLFENEVYEGIAPALARLTAKARLFVATTKPTVYAERIVAHFGLASHFEAVCGSELDGIRADKTDLLSWMLNKHKIAAEGVTMVGDRQHDVIGARNNGLKSVGVLWGYGTRAELETAGATAIFSRRDELKSLPLSAAS